MQWVGRQGFDLRPWGSGRDPEHPLEQLAALQGLQHLALLACGLTCGPVAHLVRGLPELQVPDSPSPSPCLVLLRLPTYVHPPWVGLCDCLVQHSACLLGPPAYYSMRMESGVICQADWGLVDFQVSSLLPFPPGYAGVTCHSPETGMLPRESKR